jgi:hypothetical protein
MLKINNMCAKLVIYGIGLSSNSQFEKINFLIINNIDKQTPNLGE